MEACANNIVIEDSTFGIFTARVGARILASLIYATKVIWTFAIARTFWSAVGSKSFHSRQTRTDRIVVALTTLTVGATRRGDTRIFRCFRFLGYKFQYFNKHFGEGIQIKDLRSSKHALKGSPVNPFKQEQITLWLTTLQRAFLPQGPGLHGSIHFSFSQALFWGHSELMIHSGLQDGGVPM
jgi:hypothetical protein